MVAPASPGSVEIPELLTIAETAAALRKSVRQLRWMIQQDEAPKAAKIGGRIMFRATDVAEFIAEAFETSNK